MFTLFKHVLFFLVSIALLSLTACSKKDDPSAKASSVQNLKVVVTATNAGTHIPNSTETTIGGIVYYIPESGSQTFANLAGTESVTYDNPTSKIGQNLTIRLSFNKLRGPIPANTTAALTAEFFADGVSMKKLVLNAATTASTSNTTAPVVEYTYNL